MGDFSIVGDPIDPSALAKMMNDVAAGAFVSFEGWVRDNNEGREVVALDYEAHQGIAEKEGARILAEALDRFDVIDVTCQHRVGGLKLGDCAVWVGVVSGHRGDGFAACRFVVDEVKLRVPIWKKEHYREGDSDWVNCATESP